MRGLLAGGGGFEVDLTRDTAAAALTRPRRYTDTRRPSASVLAWCVRPCTTGRYRPRLATRDTVLFVAWGDKSIHQTTVRRDGPTQHVSLLHGRRKIDFRDSFGFHVGRRVGGSGGMCAQQKSIHLQRRGRVSAG